MTFASPSGMEKIQAKESRNRVNPLTGAISGAATPNLRGYCAQLLNEPAVRRATMAAPDRPAPRADSPLLEHEAESSA
jgi:hypothetical protein